MQFELPIEIGQHLPGGYEPSAGLKLVLPAQGEHSIEAVNSWLRAEDWYPPSLASVVWFGDDGTGNFLGWHPGEYRAILWNPEDGGTPWKQGTVAELFAFVQSCYTDAT